MLLNVFFLYAFECKEEKLKENLTKASKNVIPNRSCDPNRSRYTLKQNRIYYPIIA